MVAVALTAYRWNQVMLIETINILFFLYSKTADLS